jgi:CRISPR-associated endonuclease/helicase Cas3
MRFAKIREVLKDNPADNKKVVVFSTRLIEAGVDLSFQTVIRSLAGLDSVVQAAGRCNRNHERPMGKVHLIALDNGIEKLGSLMELKQGVTSAKGVLENSTDLDLLSSDVIKTFFQSYYGALNERKEVDYKVEIRKGEFQTLFQWGNLQKDTEGSLINQEHYQNTLQQFFANEPDDKEKAKIDTFLNATAALSASPQAIASELKVIDQATTPVIVGFNPEADTDDFLSATNSLKGDVLANEIGEKINGKDIITALLSGKCDFSEISRLLKQAQAYTVQVYNLDKYRGLGKIKPMPELDIYYFYDYDKELGMDPENFDSDDSFM